MRDFVLTVPPLSGEYRARLEERFGDLEFLTLPHLRRLPIPAAVRELRSFRGATCYLPVEDPTSRALLPILELAALVAGAERIEIVDAELATTRVRPSRVVPAVGALVRGSAGGAVATARAKREVERLLAEPRLDVTPAGARRILFLNANLWFGLKAGGSVAHVAGVVNGFLSADYGVDVFTAAAPELVDARARFRPLEAPAEWGLPFELNYPRFQRQVVDEVVREARPPYAFIYQRLSLLSYAGVVLSRRLGIPLVLEYNGSEVWAARHWGRPLRQERLAVAAEDASLRHAHLVVTVSEVLAEELLRRGVEPERVVWYPNAVDPARFDVDPARARATLDLPDDALVATFIGTFGEWHGVDVLARALDRLARDDAEWLRRNRVRFVLVGDGVKMPDVRAAIDGGPAREFVTLTGLVPQSEGPRYLVASDILLSPHVPNPDGTPFFGSPTKLFEYMAAGRAIVASDLDQIGRVLASSLRADDLPDAGPGDDEPRVAVLATPADEDELVAGIRFLVERPAWRTRLGANARAEVERRYTWRHHVDAILAGVSRLSD